MKIQQCISLSILWCTYLVDLDAGRDWGQEEKGTTEDEMAGWHYQLDGLSLSELRELVMDKEAWRARFMGLQRVRHDSALNLTELTERNKRPIYRKL